MSALLANISTPFILGLLTPTTAVCILPLYPGFLAYLANQAGNISDDKSRKKFLATLGMLITLGVITFMLLLGIIFTTVLQVSLTNVIGIISPIAFGILGLISLLLIFNIDIGRFLPKFQAPAAKNPLLRGFLFGFFFGAIVIPCNPLFIAAFFTQAALNSANFVSNMISFLFFGIGIGFPLIVLSLISSTASRSIIGYLTKRKRTINMLAGIMMLAISIYYIFFVFNVFG